MSLPVSLDFTTISHRFTVKWSVPVRELLEIPKPNENLQFMSKSYRFKNIKNLNFSLTLCHDSHYKLTLHGKTDMAIFLENALILVDDLLYRAECNANNTIGQPLLTRNDILKNSFENDEVTFHCIMSAVSRVNAVFPYLYVEKTFQHSVECETILMKRDTYLDDEFDAVMEFEYSGRIPDFDVKMALRMIDEADRRHNLLLKSLCSEYLMNNLATENVTKVLKKAIESDARRLLQKCLEFLSEQCKVVPLS